MPDSTSTYAQFYYKLDSYNAYPEFGVQPFDIHKEKLHYGKVNQKQQAVIMRDLEKLNIAGSKSSVMALDFVADAFRDLQTHFQKAIAFNRISQNGKLAKGVEATRGYVSPDQAYQNYMNQIYNMFITFISASEIPKKNSIKTFEDFFRYFIDFTSKLGTEYPITKTGFIKSRFCPAEVSGLIINTSNDIYSDEDVRREWLTDPKFTFYRNAALKFGFRLDKSAPWRLYADVASYEMQGYWVETIDPTPFEIRALREDGKTDQEIIKEIRRTSSKNGLRFNPGNASNLFDLYYEKTYRSDVTSLRDMIILFYNSFVQAEPRLMTYKATSLKCYEQQVVEIQEFFRDPVTPAMANKILSPKLLSFYLFTRLIEENAFGFVPLQQFNKIMQRAGHHNKKVDFSKAVMYINSQVDKVISKKTIDVRTSQNYNRGVKLKSNPFVDYTYVKDSNE